MSLKNFSDLTQREILAIAISSEEEDGRIYICFAEDLAERYPASAQVFREMSTEEDGHRHLLLEQYQKRFGEHLPPIRREDVKGFLRRRPMWLTKNLPLDTIRKQAETMEFESRRFYEKARDSRATSACASCSAISPWSKRAMARRHRRVSAPPPSPRARVEEENHTRTSLFVLQYVQPGPRRPDGRLGLDAGAAVRRGLRDPEQLADFSGRPRRVDRRRHQHGFRGGAFRRRLAHRARLAVFARRRLRADDGARRPRPLLALSRPRHAGPIIFASPRPSPAVVVFFELWAIAYVRARYMDTPFLQAVFQIVLGGAIVLAAGVLIGGA